MVVLEMSLRVRKLPEVNVKRGPGGCAWRAARNLHMARTGQVEDPVAPTNTVADLPKRSLLERFRWMEREFVVMEMSGVCEFTMRWVGVFTGPKEAVKGQGGSCPV